MFQHKGSEARSCVPGKTKAEGTSVHEAESSW
jgi:hypothetical protein